MKRLLITVALLTFMSAMVFGQDWKLFPASYYQHSTAIVSADYRKCGNGTAYRIVIDLADYIWGNLEIGTTTGTFGAGEDITADSSGMTATIDSIGSGNLYISDASGEFFVGDTVTGDSSGAYTKVNAINFQSLVDGRIYLPSCDAVDASISYQVSGCELDSLFINIKYGAGWDISTIEPVFLYETLQDSALYWYMGDTAYELELRPGYFPAVYLVLDIYGINDSCYTGIINIYVFIERKGYN